MHMRKKGVVRCKMSYSIGGEDLPFVSNYKYLGCTVDEHLDLDDMVKEKGWMERRPWGLGSKGAMWRWGV